ncbi:hypothetical protein DES49_0467 [Halospina denitrificans]|uniref:DUF6795 domain-containing protein n=1 Tax=Halospina denitrificans TaxID=332522 RepID=A0A4R7K1A6_9GAMM|nr:DUF6795 domain-containing protein [Halospina denitrificans]TDT44365.1 hypothetical protein DES49_0467 [Halospina denitrificans]
MMITPKLRKPALAMVFTALALTLIPLTSSQVMADMFGFFKRYDVHLSPEVHGRITLNGTPLEEVQVSRELTYGKEYLDRTTTDVNGRFYFAEKNIRSGIPGKLFNETRNRQVIVADYEGEKYLLWHTVTDSIEPHETLTQLLKSMDCELSNPEKLQHFERHENPSFTHNIHSICRWSEDEH